MKQEAGLIERLGAQYPVQEFNALEQYSRAAYAELKETFAQDVEQIVRDAVAQAMAGILQRLSAQGHSVLLFKDYRDFHGDAIESAATLQDFVRLIVEEVEEGRMRDFCQSLDTAENWAETEYLIGKPTKPR